MRKLIAIFRKCSPDTSELRIYECKHKLVGELRNSTNGEIISFADFLEADRDNTEYRVREYFGFYNQYYTVPFERKNGKIVLYPVNKQRRVIWSNNDYDEWCEAMQGEITEDEINPETYYGECEMDLDAERANLNKETCGYIVAFADLGLWNGRVNGAKLVGENVSDILSSLNSCDYGTFYCDPYNVRFEGVHHDGTNRVLYRIAKDKEYAEWLVNEIAYHGMDESRFRKLTLSLRPDVAATYGW